MRSHKKRYRLKKMKQKSRRANKIKKRSNKRRYSRHKKKGGSNHTNVNRIEKMNNYEINLFIENLIFSKKDDILKLIKIDHLGKANPSDTFVYNNPKYDGTNETYDEPYSLISYKCKFNKQKFGDDIVIPEFVEDCYEEAKKKVYELLRTNNDYREQYVKHYDLTHIEKIKRILYQEIYNKNSVYRNFRNKVYKNDLYYERKTMSITQLMETMPKLNDIKMTLYDVALFEHISNTTKEPANKLYDLIKTDHIVNNKDQFLSYFKSVKQPKNTYIHNVNYEKQHVYNKLTTDKKYRKKYIDYYVEDKYKKKIDISISLINQKKLS